MKLTVLGEYGPYAKNGNATSSYLLEEGNTKILLDAGSGSLSRLSKYVNPNQLTAIIITHLHYDHIADLGLYFYAIKDIKIPLYYPDCSEVVTKAIECMSCFEIKKIHDYESITVDNLRIKFIPSIHPVKCNGVYIENSEGKSLYYAGDSRYSEDMLKYSTKADLFICDCPYIASHNDRTPHISYAECLTLSKQIKGQTIISHHNPEVEIEVLKELISGYYVELAKEGDIYTI